MKKTSKQEGKGRPRAKPAAQTKLANRAGIAESKRREQLLAGVIASAMDAIITIDERHEITLVNPAVEQLFGYSEAELLGKPLSMLIPERYREAHDAHIRNFARTKLTNRGMGGFGQIVGRRAGGREFQIDASIAQAEYAGERLFTVVLRDVTQRIEAERALQKNYELLDRIFATTHFCIVYLDRDFHFVRVNQAYADACGYPAEFFAGKNHFELYPGEKVEAIFRQVVATGQPFTIYANPFQFPDHPERGLTYWDWTLHPLRTADGAVDGLLFALLDVTERTRATQELERKTALAQLLESLARAANEAATPEEAMKICLMRLCDFGNWTLGRVATADQLGGDPGLPDDSVWHAADLARHAEFIRVSRNVRSLGEKGQFIYVVLREKKPVWLTDITEAHGFVRRATALADGLRAAFAFPVVVQGEVVAFLEFYADTPRPVDSILIAASEIIAAQIAHLIERSRAMRRQAQLAAIVESSNDAILIRGLDRSILSWNAAAERLFGWSAQEAVGQSIELIVPPERTGTLRRIMEGVARGESLSPVETIHLRKDGARIPTQITFSPVRDQQGKVVAHSYTVRDMTELKRQEEGLRGYATRLRELSHRLRTVEEAERHAISRELHDRIGQDLSTLGLILGSLGAKLSRESLRSVAKPLQDMQGLLKAMVANVRDIMAVLRPPVLDDYGLLAALRQLVTEFAQRTGIAAELSGVEFQPRLPPIVETAMFRISQEALNNIAKHAQAKNVEISIHEASGRVMLEIADNGIGFDANETPPDKQHWGLSTMRERAEAVGIVFSLESAPGAGTRIVVEAERVAI
jgi:PAS domain S-box-containing protein